MRRHVRRSLRPEGRRHHSRQQRVAIVTDSAADIPEALLEQLDIHVVPVRVQFGGRSYLDKVTLSPDEFDRELATNPAHPKTSQPPPGDFRRIYEFLASHYESVLSIAVTSKVSGTYNAALTGAQRVNSPNRPVRVLDSANASLGQGLIVIAAAEAARAGGSLQDCERGGRVPKAVKRFADLLRFSVVLASFPDGSVGLGGVIFRRSRPVQRFAKFVVGKLLKDAPADSPAALPPGSVASSHVLPLGTALDVHGGPGMLVVGVQRA